MSRISHHEEKMLTLQHQMRENNMDLEAFVKDMNRWEDDIKKKEKDLITGKPVKDQELPPVRNSLQRKKKKKVKKDVQENGTGKPRKRISGYDYRSWDKLDIDKMCEDVDKKDNSESSEYETDDEWEAERKKQQAAMEKDAGNDYFKRGDYINAIESYTKGMALDPTNPILPANRAMALLKEQKFAAAEMDCVTALTLDPLYVKAYLRLGSAQFQLKKLQKAKETFEKVLQLEPQNKQAKLEMERIEKEMKKEKMVTHNETSPDLGIVKPITIPPNKRSKKPLRRIEIEEVGLEETDIRQSAMSRVQEGHSQQRRNIESKENQSFEKLTSQAKKIPPKCIDNPGDIFCDESGLSGNSPVDKSAKSVISQKQSGSDSKSDVRLGLKELTSARTENKSLSPRSLSVPGTSYQFQTDYKLVKNDLAAFYDYVKKIDPAMYPRLFGEMLDAEVLMKILTVFQKYYKSAGESYYQNMCKLTEVKRFSMTVMFFSSKEKQVIKDLLSGLEGQISDTEVKTLSSKYQIS